MVDHFQTLPPIEFISFPTSLKEVSYATFDGLLRTITGMLTSNACKKNVKVSGNKSILLHTECFNDMDKKVARF
jgi:hypothetical protein